MNSPSAIKPLIARAAAPSVSVGRMIEQIGNLRIEEDCRLGHDQVGLGQFAVGVEVGKCTIELFAGSKSGKEAHCRLCPATSGSA